ncbi:major facilitator superfamily domain-containing protein 8 isoform X3 [Hydra vulgaris]|uniref:Major facilitator superfamily domain-containing protein 8 isoform X3 n=1 Tax=Hydra vulgaris TaxID=6087 RepID=A0ABM4BRH1_HYDVU
MNLNTRHHEKWLKKRKLTFIAFSIQLIIVGIEYSFTILTLWSYIKKMITTDTPKLYYGVVSVSYMVASSVVTPIIGRIVDKKRNVNHCFLICNMLMITGNVLYSLPFSPFFLVGGRVMAGFGGALESVIFSEVIRSYPASETSSKLSVLSIMYNLGFILGPGVNFFFKDISFFIGNWHIRDVNFPGLFMGFVCIAMEILTITMVYDVSKEFDYKALAENTAINNTGDEVYTDCDIIDNDELPLMEYNYPKEKNTKTLSINSDEFTIIKILKLLFLRFDSALVMLSNFFLSFFIISTDTWLPLLVFEKLHLSMKELNICFMGACSFSAFSLLLFILRSFSDKKMILVLLISLVGFCTVSTSFIILSNYSNSKLKW